MQEQTNNFKQHSSTKIGCAPKGVTLRGETLPSLGWPPSAHRYNNQTHKKQEQIKDLKT
jgi:hypothetical protein